MYHIGMSNSQQYPKLYPSIYLSDKGFQGKVVNPGIKGGSLVPTTVLKLKINQFE